MVCLEPLLHNWWGKAYFALEPVEKLPNGTRVCLRWLPRTNLSVHERLPLNSDPRNYMNPPGEPGVVGMRDFVSGHPLLDGATFDLTSEDSELEVSFDMLELQWDLLRMAALCGAADAADDPNWNPGDDDPCLNPGLFDDLSHRRWKSIIVDSRLRRGWGAPRIRPRIPAAQEARNPAARYQGLS